MKEKTLTIIILVLAYIIFPIGAGYIIGKLFMNHNGIALEIILFSLIALELAAVVYKVVKYKKDKK